MRIYKIAFPLPLDEIPIERGEDLVDYALTQKEAEILQKRFSLVRSLGGGQFGIAYLTSDNKVLKITTDINEVNAAKQLMEFKHGPFAEIYDIGEIKDNVYYILKEKIKTLSEQEKNLMYEVIDAEYGGEPVDEIYENSELKEKMEDYITEVSNYMQFSDSLNLGNIGKDQYGNIVCFDCRTSN